MALLELQRSPAHEVVGLFTTVGSDTHRIPFHNVRIELVRAQAEALGLPLYEVELPARASDVQYEAAIRSALAGLRRVDGLSIAYGDLFLQDIREFREELAARLGVMPVFPVWKRDTRRFVHDFLAAGFDAIVASVDLSRLDGTLAGRRLDTTFLADLPPDLDQCGENGEFHTFVLDGPTFSVPLRISIGAFAERDRHCYREISLA